MISDRPLPAALHPPCLGANVDDVHVARVHDRERSVVEALRRLDDPDPVVGADALGADPVPGDARRGAQHPHPDLVARHLEGEHGDRSAVRGDVVRDVDRERGLPDARSGGDDHEVVGLEPRRQLVEVSEARREPGVGRLAVLDLLELDHRGVDQLAERGDLVAVVPSRDVVDPLLRGVRDRLGILRCRVRHVHDVGGRPDQSPEQGGLRDDPRVVRGGGRGRDLVGEVPDVQRAADVVESPLPPEGLHGGQLVDGLPARVQLAEHLEDPPVRRTVEVLGLEELDDVGDGLGRQHHRTEGSRLRLHVVRRDALDPRPLKVDDVVSRADDPAHPPSPVPVSEPATLRPGAAGA